MTLREVIDVSLLAKATPDAKTSKQNIQFLQNTAQKMGKGDQQKMQAVIDGMKKTEMFTTAQKEEEEKQNKIKQVQKPIGTNEKSAQPSDTSTTAQVSNNAKTAQANIN